MPDGDFVDLDFSRGDSDTLVCLFHGLEGSIDSPYIRGIMAALDVRGYRSVLMHFRGCSGVPNRQIQSYHSGHTDDMRHLFSTLAQREPQTRLVAIGYSLGGNALLKYQGEQGEGSPLSLAIAVSPPFVLSAGARRLDTGFSKIYQRKLIGLLKKSVRQKMSAMDDFPLELDDLKSLNNFWRFDDRVTARLNGFSGVDEYYRLSSCRQYLKSIRRPTHILHALNDPFFDIDMIPDHSHLSDQVTLELSRNGGHVGFIGGALPGKPFYWLDQRICDLLDATLRTKPAGPSV